MGFWNTCKSMTMGSFAASWKWPNLQPAGLRPETTIVFFGAVYPFTNSQKMSAELNLPHTTAVHLSSDIEKGGTVDIQWHPCICHTIGAALLLLLAVAV